MKIGKYETHPAADLFPMMEGDDLQALAENIKAHGLQNPIILIEQDGKRLLLDGRNRARACEMAGVAPAVEIRSLSALGARSALEYVVSANLRRLHLDASQRAMLGAEIKKMFEAEAKARRGARTDLSANLRGSDFGKATEKAAALVNVSARSVEHASIVAKHGTPEMVEVVKAGQVAVSAAANDIRKLNDAAKGKKKVPERWVMRPRRGGGTRRVPRDPDAVAKFLMREWPPSDIEQLVRHLIKLRPDLRDLLGREDGTA